LSHFRNVRDVLTNAALIGSEKAERVFGDPDAFALRKGAGCTDKVPLSRRMLFH